MRDGGRETSRLREVERGVASSRALPAWMRRMRLSVRSSGRNERMRCFRVAVVGPSSAGIETRRSGRDAEKRIVIS